jgi:outer membrane receptor for ferrienterochelin and colicin
MSLVASAKEDGTVRYGQEYFSKYNAVTLEDMIRTLPGGAPIITILQRNARYSSGNRGFGSSGAQFLINGKRMAGKANDMLKNLTRVQAKQVDYIELIRGNAEGLDIRNEGILINVILKKGAENSSSTYVEYRLDYAKHIKPKPNGQIAHNGKRGDFSYGLNVLYSERPTVYIVEEDVLNADETIRQFRPLQKQNNRDDLILSGNIGLDMGNNGLFRLNGLYSTGGKDEFSHEDHFDVDAGGNHTLAAYEDTVFDFAVDKWEVGGDYERKIGILGNLKALFIVNQSDHIDTITQDNTPTNGFTTNNFTSNADYTQKEQIIRASITTHLTKGHSLEWGGEGAFNTLDKAQLFADAADDIALVKEDRFEAFATHSFTISDKASLSSSLTAEFSKVGQEREGLTNSRSYNFLKPRFEFRYDFTGSDQLRLMSERKVSQLNLNHFIATRNVADDTITFGNPNLVPEKTWSHSISYEKRFPNDAGSIEVKLVYATIKDHIDRISIGDILDYTSGVGNVNDARKLGLEAKGNLRLAFLGLENAVVNASIFHYDNKTEDVFSGENRMISDPLARFWEIEFQQDLTDWNASYGFTFHHQARNDRHDIRLYESRTAGYHLFGYAEYTFDGIKAKFHVGHIFKDNKWSTKTIYVGDIQNDNVERFDNNHNWKSPDMYFSLQTTF